MGGSGRIYRLVALRTKVGSNAAVRTAITKVLHDTWSYLGDWRTMAFDWMAVGESSLLKIQHDDELRAPATTVEAWYVSAEWFRAFAEHVVELALAWSRRDIEISLAKLGLAIDPSAWPPLDRVLADGRFVMHEGKLGQLEPGDDHVRWWSADWKSTVQELDDLSPELRARLASPTRCECPMCARFAGDLWPVMRVRQMYRATRVQVWHRAEHLLAPRTGGLLFVGSTPWMGAAWALRTVGGDAPWITIEQLCDRLRSVELLSATSNAYVALFVTKAGHPRLASVSPDGATWSDPAPTGLPAMKKSTATTHAHRSEIVYVIAPATKGVPPQLHRSDDGGLTFAEPTRPTLDGAAPKVIHDVIACDGRILIIATPKRGAPLLAICDDASGTFTSHDLGDFEIARAATSNTGVAVLFGSGPAMRLSRDQGRTWSAHAAPANVVHAVLGGRWFVIERDVGIHVSDDEGETWTLIAEGMFTGLATDHADPISVYALIGGVAMHLVANVVRRDALRCIVDS